VARKCRIRNEYPIELPPSLDGGRKKKTKGFSQNINKVRLMPIKINPVHPPAKTGGNS
jgi:hypothetical protein